MRFPNELFRNEDDRRAVLGMKMCTLAHGYRYFHDFITSTLQDSNLSLRELLLRVNSTPSTTMLEFSISDPLFLSTWRYMHTVLLVRSRRPEREWVIDITGAQFGIQKPLFSVEEYKILYVNNIDSNKPFGQQNLLAKRMAEKDTHSGVRDLATLQAMDSFMRGVKKWEQYESITLSKLLSVSDDEFLVQKSKLLGYAGRWVDRFIRTSNFLALTMEALDLERNDPGRGQRIQNEVNMEIVFSNWQDSI